MFYASSRFGLAVAGPACGPILPSSRCSECKLRSDLTFSPRRSKPWITKAPRHEIFFQPPECMRDDLRPMQYAHVRHDAAFSMCELTTTTATTISTCISLLMARLIRLGHVPRHCALMPYGVSQPPALNLDDLSFPCIDRRWCSADWHSTMSGSSPGTDFPAFWRSAPKLPASQSTAVSEPASLQPTFSAQWSSSLARNPRNIRTREKENLGRPADRRSSGFIASCQLLCSLRTRPETSSSAQLTHPGPCCTRVLARARSKCSPRAMLRSGRSIALPLGLTHTRHLLF